MLTGKGSSPYWLFVQTSLWCVSATLLQRSLKHISSLLHTNMASKSRDSINSWKNWKICYKKSNTFQITHVFIMFFKQLISKKSQKMLFLPDLIKTETASSLQSKFWKLWGIGYILPLIYITKNEFQSQVGSANSMLLLFGLHCTLTTRRMVWHWHWPHGWLVFF